MKGNDSELKGNIIMCDSEYFCSGSKLLNLFIFQIVYVKGYEPTSNEDEEMYENEEAPCDELVKNDLSIFVCMNVKFEIS